MKCSYKTCLNKAIYSEINNLDEGVEVKSSDPMGRWVCWKHQCLTLHLAVLHMQEHQGVKWQSGGRHQRQTAEPQLPQQCHGIIVQASVGKFVVIAYLTLCVAAELGYWNPVHTSTPGIRVTVWCERRARPSLPLPRHWAGSERWGGVVSRACRPSLAEPGFLGGPLTPLNSENHRGFPRSLQSEDCGFILSYVHSVVPFPFVSKWCLEAANRQFKMKNHMWEISHKSDQ